MPGITVPLLLVATQGIGRPFDLLVAQYLLPALAYVTMGGLDGLLVGLGIRRSLLTGAAFAAGILLGPWMAAPVLHRFPFVVGIAVMTAVPWISGTFALAGFLRRPVPPQGACGRRRLEL